MNRTSRLYRGLSGVLRTHYPNFALGLPLGSDEIPVFVYHDVETSAFATDLEFLRSNGYRTLSLEEFMRRRESGSAEKTVLLTFDDARKNFYSTALPVLRDFNARASLFAPTYWMTAAETRPAADDLFMSWQQLQACVDSGLVDVQSHAHRHALVCQSGQPVGFATPELLARYDIYDWPMRHTSAGDQLGRPALGSPIYDASPLLSASKRYLESEAATRACLDEVAQAGGAAFFADPKWEARLQSVHDQAATGAPGQMVAETQFRELVASEFEISRDEFRRHLGYTPQYLAYPWMLGSALSLELARQFDMRCVFGVALDYAQETKRNLPVRVFGRVKADWLPTLPGKGRTSLMTVAARKLTGFSKTLHLAH